MHRNTTENQVQSSSTPVDLELEAIVLGHAVSVGGSLGIPVNCFSFEAHRLIAETILEHEKRGRPIDMVSILSTLRFKSAGWVAHDLARVFDSYSDADRPSIFHARRWLLGLARVRELQNACALAFAELGDTSSDLEERIAAADGRLFPALEAAKDAAIALEEADIG